MGSTSRLLVVFGQARRHDRAVAFATLHHREQSRSHELLKGDQRRDRIARKPEHRAPRERHEGERSAGPHLHAPEPHVAAEVRQHLLDPIAVADGDAAGGDDGVAAKRLAEARRNRVGLVTRDAQVYRQRADLLERGLETVAARGDDTAIVHQPVRLDQLIARGQDCDARARDHTNLCTTQGRQHANQRGAQQRARHCDLQAGAHVAADLAHVGARLDGAQHADPVPVSLGVFLHDDAVRTLGERRARQDARHLARAELVFGELAGRDLGHHAQLDWGAGGVLGPERVPIHGRVLERRDRTLGRHRLGQHPALRLGQAHRLGA